MLRGVDRREFLSEGSGEGCERSCGVPVHLRRRGSRARWTRRDEREVVHPSAGTVEGGSAGEGQSSVK